MSLVNSGIATDVRCRQPLQIISFQGDQIGRIFAHWVIVYYMQFFITNLARIFGATFFSHTHDCALSSTKMFLATFGVIFYKLTRSPCFLPKYLIIKGAIVTELGQIKNNLKTGCVYFMVSILCIPRPPRIEHKYQFCPNSDCA
jgi:hypothetical protein